MCLWVNSVLVWHHTTQNHKTLRDVTSNAYKCFDAFPSLSTKHFLHHPPNMSCPPNCLMIEVCARSWESKPPACFATCSICTSFHLQVMLPFFNFSVSGWKFVAMLFLLQWRVLQQFIFLSSVLENSSGKEKYLSIKKVSWHLQLHRIQGHNSNDAKEISLLGCNTALLGE